MLRMGLQLILPSASLDTTPGRTSISWPSCAHGGGEGESRAPPPHTHPRHDTTRKTHLEDTLEERTTGDTALELVHLGTGLVDVKRANDDELGRRRKVAHGDRDLVDDELDERVNVVPQLGRDGDDGRPVGDGALDKLEDLLVVLVGLLLADEVDLVLQDEDVLELHDLDRGEVLRRLRLGARLVGGDEEECGVHDGGTVEHGGHENVVTRAVDERDVAADAFALFSVCTPRRNEGEREEAHRRSFIVPPHPGTSQGGWSSLSDEYDLKLPGRSQLGFSHL